MRRRALGGAIALAVSACLPAMPLTAGAAMKSPSIQPGSYGRLTPGMALKLSDLRPRPATAGPRPSPPLIVKNPVAYAAAKAASGRTAAAKAPLGMHATIPLVSQGTVEEQLTVFPGMDLVQGFNAFGTDQSREPPDTQIAVGPDTVVETVNSNMSVWSKSGTRLQAVDLNLFYSPAAGYSVTDSRILYDTQSNRFILSSVANNPPAGSILELAVSQSSDPTSSWTRWQVKTAAQVLIDQPSVGTSDDKVTIAWAEAVPPPCQNQTTYYCFTGQFIAVLQKSDLLSSGAPSTYATAGDLNRFGIVPAQALSSTSTQYLVYNNADPYFLVENNCPPPAPPGYYGNCPTLGEISLTGTPAAHNIAMTEVDPLILPTTAPVNAGQLGSSTLINTGDDRLVSAVWRNGRLWTSATDGNCSQTNPNPANVTESCVRVIESLTNQGGMIFHHAILNAGSDFTYYPAVSTDNAGDVFVVFSRSTSSMYPGVWVSGLLFGDVAAWSPMTLLKAGNGPYDSTAGTCGGHNRWGDYSGAATDPTDPTDVWVAGEYALNNPNTCVWGTAIGRLTYSAPTVTSVTPAIGPSAGGTAATITGTDFVTAATTIYFGATPSPSGATTVLTPNSLTTTTPPGNGWVNVSASTADGHDPPGPFFKYPRIEAAPGSVGSLVGASARGGAPPHVPESPAGTRPAFSGPTLPSPRGGGELEPSVGGGGELQPVPSPGGGVELQPVRLLRLLLL